jgi:hypothetical protein
MLIKSASTVMVFSFLLLHSCDSGAARGGWETVVRSCAESDIFRKDVKFFGPSNVLGPGSVWRLQETLSPSFTLANVASDASTLVQPGNEIKPCQGKGVTSWDISLGLPLTVAAQGEPNAPVSPTGSPVSIDLKTAFTRAKTVEVSVDGVALDLLLQTPYEDVLDKLPADNIYKKDSLKPNRWVITKGLRVSNLAVKFVLDKDFVTDAQVKLPEGSVVSFGKDGAKFKIHYNSDKTVTLASPQVTYLAGVVRPLEQGQVGLGGQQGKLKVGEQPLNLRIAIGPPAPVNE